MPTLDEYLFAATNGGNTRFPWGDDADIISSWDVAASLPPEFDKTRGDPPVRGLFSRVVEWTQSIPEPLQMSSPNGKTGIDATSKMLGFSEPINSRFLVGGGPSIKNGRPQPVEFSFGPRGFNQASIFADPDQGVGFRCARSVKPRFVEE